MSRIKSSKYKREIQLLGDYKNYYLDKVTMLELSKIYKLSGSRIRYILGQIHVRFFHFLNTNEHKHLYELMCHSHHQTKRDLEEQPAKLAELLVVFDIFAENRKVEADGLTK